MAKFFGFLPEQVDNLDYTQVQEMIILYGEMNKMEQDKNNGS